MNYAVLWDSISQIKNDIKKCRHQTRLHRGMDFSDRRQSRDNMPRHRQRKTANGRNRKEPWTFGNLLCEQSFYCGSVFKALVCPGLLLFCSPSEALEQAPGGWVQAGSQGPAEILLHSGSSSWLLNGCALSPGNSYSLISSWNTAQILPNMVLGT